MSLRLGFFANFKGEDSVLLCGLIYDLRFLSASLANFFSSTALELPIHSFTEVHSRHMGELLVIRSANMLSTSRKINQFYWSLTENALHDALGKIDVLIGSGSGHQYFSLTRPASQLIVSLNEYNADWWEEA